MKSVDMYSSSRSKEEAQTAVVFQDFDAFITRQPCLQQVFYVGGADSDEVSDPTVQDQHDTTSLSDDNLSIMSEKSFRNSHDIPVHKPVGVVHDDDDLSISSINTKGVNLINDLKKRLQTQESTKLGLLNLCLELERKLEKFERKHICSMVDYKAQNHQLRETSAKMEHDFMNAMNDVVTKMAHKEEEYNDKIQWRDQRIRFLEEELKLFLRLSAVKKNLDDDDSTIETCFSAKVSSVYDEMYSYSKQERSDNLLARRTTKENSLIPSEVIVSIKWRRERRQSHQHS